MDQTYLHLLVSHLPIFGALLGAFVLIFGLWGKSKHTLLAAYLLFLISAAGAGIAYLTGEAAEETVENIRGISKDAVEEHEEFAFFVLVAFIGLGVLSIICMILTTRKPAMRRGAAIITLLVSLICFGMAAWAGYLGGHIRHAELYPDPAGTEQDRIIREKQD